MHASLLAGPILRRVTQNRVCVWIATNKPVSLKIRVVSSQDKQLGESDLGDLSKHCSQLGKTLFIYLLQARCNAKEKYPIDELLYYRLLEVTDSEQEEEWDLSDLSLDNAKLPGFYIPGKIKRLLHGSCRKPHGCDGAIPDALSIGVDILAENPQDLNQRPAILLLTGDQIYADDVSISVLSMLRKHAEKLIGKQELMPVESKSSEGNLLNQINPNEIRLHDRKQFLKEGKSEFSSGESENHLLSFGEFAAMYLYVFGNVQNWEPTFEWQQISMECSADSEVAKKAFEEQADAVKKFHETLPKVRRLLANISTYMIFDDHDVTDDWNITSMWYDKVRNSPLGRRIVSNALASYWGFQGWGNDPDNYDKELRFTISQHLLNQSEDAEKGERYDLHIWKHRGWGFSIPTDPPIIAIDSRTQRESETNSYLPMLLDRYARDWLRVEWAKLKTSQKITVETCPVFIATTPVLGFSVIERVQKFTLWLARYVDSYKVIEQVEHLFKKDGFFTRRAIKKMDVEAWTSNKHGFLVLMKCLSKRMRIKQCVFLSGDVHYSFSAIGKHAEGENTLYCYQLTSSSLKNSPNEFQGKSLERAGRFRAGVTKHTHWFKAIIPFKFFKSWETKVHLLPVDKTQNYVHSNCNLGLVEFADGRPVKHILMNGGDNEHYLIPEAKYIDTLETTA